MDCTESRKRVKLGEPAYDSSPRIKAAHCAVDMAPVPESVSRSIRISSDETRKRFHPAASSSLRRSAIVVRRIGSTDLIRKGSIMVLIGIRVLQWNHN